MKKILIIIILCTVSALWADTITDDFSRTNTAYSANGAYISVDWVNSEQDDTWRINNNTLQADPSGDSCLYNNALQLGGSFIVKFDIYSEVDGWIGIVFNYQNSQNYYLLRIKLGTHDVQIMSKKNGAFEELDYGSASVIFSTGTIYRFTVNSDTNYHFNFTVTEAGSSTVLNLITNVVDNNHNFTGGYAGGFSRIDATFDDFSLESGPLNLSDVLTGFETRRDAAFELLRNDPLVVAEKAPPLGEGRPLYTRNYSWSIIDFAFKVFWLEETNYYQTANDALTNMCDYYINDQAARDDRDNFYWSTDEMVRLIEFFGSNGSRTAGLISPLCNEMLKELMWLYVKNNSKIADAEYVNSKTWHVYESENHHIQKFSTLWHFSKILQNEPMYQNRNYDDGFIASNHYNAWTAYSMEWLVERAKKGLFIEMANGNYCMQTIKGIYNFFDFGDDDLKLLSRKLLDLYWAAWAQEQIKGVRGGGKSRVYQSQGWSRTGRDEFWRLMWYYTGINFPEGLKRTTFDMATSCYRLPLIVLDLILDPVGRGDYEIKQRRQGLAAPDNNYPDYSLCTNGGGIVRYSYCTPEFIIGTALIAPLASTDWTMISSQNRWQGAIFAGNPDARIFFQTKNADPNEDITTFNQFWSVQSKGSLISQRLTGSQIGTSICVWFSDAGRIGNLYEQSGWVFAEFDDAYAAVKCVSGSYSFQDHPAGSSGRDAGKWMICADDSTPVILEVAKKSDFATFTDFQTNVIALPLAYASNVLDYQGLSGDQLTFYADRSNLPKVNGVTINLEPVQVFDSPFIQSEYNSGVVEIQKDERSLELNFNERVLLDVTDDFNRPDTAYSSAGANIGAHWVNPDINDDWRIYNNTLQANPNSDGFLFDNTTQLLKFFTVSIDVAPEIWAGMVFNYQNTSNYYLLRIKSDNNDVQIMSCVNDTFEELDYGNVSVTFVPGTLYTLTVTSRDNYNFDFTVTEAGNSTVLNSVTNVVDANHNFINGYVGAYTHGFDATFDNFNLQQVPEPITVGLWATGLLLVSYFKTKRKLIQ